MNFKQKLANKNKIPYSMTKRIYIGDFKTYIESTGDGTFVIKGNKSNIFVDSNGDIGISGASSIKLNGKDLDFNELPDRFIRPSGVSWTWIANNTEVFGVLPIRIKGQKVYIPFINKQV